METTATRKKRKKRMRLPSGLGSVHMIGGNKQRRKPWRARVLSHVEIDETTGKATQKYITIGYFEREIDAIEALMEYRKNPYTMDAATATFEEVFEMWKKKKYADASDAAKRGYNSAFKNSQPLHKMKMRDIRAIHMEQAMNSLTVGFKAQAMVKTLWSQLFKYAIEHDIVQKNYSEFVPTKDKDPGTKRTAIPAEDREKIWQAIDAGDHDAEIAMVYIYTGLRATELLEIKKDAVNLETRILIGGKKTGAGTDRHVPIHPCIMPIIQRMMQTESDYLVSKKGRGGYKAISYETFKNQHWTPLMDRLGMKEYTPHYCRHTCATMLREANVAEDIRKLILGHKSGDITDRYTHISDDMLVAAMDTVNGRE